VSWCPRCRLAFWNQESRRRCSLDRLTRSSKVGAIPGRPTHCHGCSFLERRVAKNAHSACSCALAAQDESFARTPAPPPRTRRTGNVPAVLAVLVAGIVLSDDVTRCAQVAGGAMHSKCRGQVSGAWAANAGGHRQEKGVRSRRRPLLFCENGGRPRGDAG